MTTLFVVAWTIAVGSWILAMIEWPSHVAFRASCLWVGPSSLGPGREAAAASVAQRLGGRDDDGEVQGRPARYLPVPSGTLHLRLRAPHSFPDQGRLAVGRIPVGTTIFFAAWLVGWTVEDSRSRQLNPRSSAFPLRFSVGCSASGLCGSRFGTSCAEL